jgi:hypothetical protein
MAKHPNKYIRLPVHLACKTCPRGQVDCCIELSEEHPDGNLHKKCATCLSSNCGFTKKDKTAREARVELRKWMDEELGRKRKETGKRRAAETARDETFGIFALDGPPVVAPDSGGRAKRNRPNYVDSESDGDDIAIDVRPKRARAQAGRVAALTPTSSEQSRSAINTDFVQQAIKLVTSSQTIEEQLADMQKNIDTQIALRVSAEETIKGMEEHQTGKDKEKDREMEETMKAVQAERDELRIKTTGLQKKLDDQVELTEQQSQNATREYHKLQAEWRIHLEGVRNADLIKDAKIAEAEEESADCKEEVVKEKEEHVKTTSQLVKWKATFAALQGLQ